MNKYQKIYPGIPLVESPFFDEFCDQEWSGETLRIAKDLNKNGLAVVDILKDEALNTSDLIINNLHHKYDWSAWKEGLIESLRIQDAWRIDQNVKKIATNHKLLDLLSSIYGRKAFPFQTLNFPVGTQQALHCDYAHFSSVPERFMCGVWVAFEDMTEENGALIYYPGSHKFKTMNNEDIGRAGASIKNAHDTYSSFIELWEKLADSIGIKPEKFLAKKGQAVIWLSNLIHGGSKMQSKAHTRNSQVTHYFFEDCAYTTTCSNDVYAGQVRYLDVCDINTGKNIANKVSGIEIDESTKEKLMPQYIKFPKSNEKKLPRDFDPIAYLEINEDVRASGVSPYLHYLNFGIYEGRRYKNK